VDGTGSAAHFYLPSGIATDAAGNVYVADQFNRTIRRVTQAGVVTTLAGSPGNSGTVDGTGSAARFVNPTGVATDTAGNVYVGDQYTVRKITPAGVVTTLAGTPGASGSADGTGSAARFSGVSSVATDTAGNIYVADSFNNEVRAITTAGVVTTLAGSASRQVFYYADGTGTAALFNQPGGVATDAAGNIYVTDFYNYSVRKIAPGSVVTTFAGTPPRTGNADGTGINARFAQPLGVARVANGDLYVSDSLNNSIRKITNAGAVTTVGMGVVTTIAGGTRGFNDGTGSAAQFFALQGMASDTAGNIYIADNNAIRLMTPAGVVTTPAGSVAAGSTDGPGVTARFNQPHGIATDAAGNVYVSDTYNATIRKITAAGVVSTLAGSAGVPGSADGTGNAARFYLPYGVATDASGNIFVTDQFENTIRKITPGGVVTTLAGTAGTSGYVDATGTSARFYFPQGLSIDANGNLYVAELGNQLIRKVTPAGVVTTIAGIGNAPSGGTTGSSVTLGDLPGTLVDPVGIVVLTTSPTTLAITDRVSNAVLIIGNLP
jgi:hypothetical protein